MCGFRSQIKIQRECCPEARIHVPRKKQAERAIFTCCDFLFGTCKFLMSRSLFFSCTVSLRPGSRPSKRNFLFLRSKDQNVLRFTVHSRVVEKVLFVTFLLLVRSLKQLSSV